MSNNNPEQRPPSFSTSPPAFPGTTEEMVKACENVAAFSFHNPTEAISQANELCIKHDNVPLVHLTRGQILRMYVSNLCGGDKNIIKHLREAINSLQRGVDMCPQSLLYSYNLAEAYFQLARLHHADYDKAVQECERALSMDGISQIPRMEGKLRDHHEKLKGLIEELNSYAKAAKEEGVARVDQKKIKKMTELDLRKIVRKVERIQDFVKKTEEYWRELTYDEKCRIIDVKVKDVESFYGSSKNKNSQALSVLMEAVGMYREKRHWFTWTCCFCKEDRKKEDYDVWKSVEKHIDNHFDDPEPRLKGSFNYDCVGNFDSLDISDGIFVLHNVLDEQMITKERCNAPIPNNKFLSEWFTDDHDVKMQLELWENRRVQTSRTASIIYDQIAELKEDMKGILEKLEKEKQKTEEDMQTALSDEISTFEEEIRTFKRQAVCLSVSDYRQIIVPLLKYFIQARLECEAEEQATREADAKTIELIKNETPKNNNVRTKSKTNKEKIHDNKSQNREGSQPQKQNKIQAPIADQEQESPATSVKESTIFIGSIPITLKTPKSKEKEIAHEAVDIAREAEEHPPENLDDANVGWIEVTQKKKREKMLLKRSSRSSHVI